MKSGIALLARYAGLVVCAAVIAGCSGGGGSSDSAATAPPTVVASPVTTWFLPVGTTLDPAQTAPLFDAGQLYVDVQSAASSTGEIRGGIQPIGTGFATDNGGDPFAPNPAGTPVTFAAILGGDQVRPRNVVTAATGYGAVTIDPQSKLLTGFVVTSGIAGTGAQIMDALPGSDGTPVLTLEGGPVVWTVPANTLLSDTQMARLQSGAYYLSVASSTFPAGEIRGQLDQQVRSATLKSSNIVPPVTSSASGVGYLAMKKSTRQFSGFVTVSGLGSAISSIALHIGPAGTNGIVIAVLENRGNGIWAVPLNTVLGDAQVTSFNNDQLYFSVHTTGNPGGEIRGQLLKPTIRVGSALLDGSKVVPPVVTQGTGAAYVALNSVTGQLSGALKTDKVTGTAARVHSGSATTNGPTVAALSGGSPVTQTPSPGISFALDIQPLFTARCAGTFCHVTGGIAPMSLQPGLAYANTRLLVIPGNSAGSYFVKRLTGEILPRMPLAGAPLNTTELGLIKAWIDSGAVNN